MDLYLVVGNPNTRRASLVRSLTGCFNRSVRDIELLSGKKALRVYARVGSLQETKTSPEDFLTEVAATRCEAVLCCLAPNAHPSLPARLPSVQAYLEYFREVGWRVRGIAVLGQNTGGLKSPSLMQFPQSGTVPINLTACAVRLSLIHI